MSTSKGVNNDSLNDDFLALNLDVVPDEDPQQEEGLTEEDKEALEQPSEEQEQQEETGQTEQQTGEKSEEDDEDYWEKFFSGESSSEDTTEETEESQTESEEETQAESEEETSQDEEKKEGTSEDGEADTPLHLHAAIMKERGLLPSSFDLNEVKGENLQEQIESLADVIERGYEDRYKNLKSNLDNLSKEVVEKIEQGFTEEEAKQSVIDRAKIENIDDQSLEGDQEMQEKLVRQYHSMLNVPEATIEKYIKKAKDSDSLYDDAKEARSELPELYRKQDEQEQQRRQQEEEQRRERQKKLEQQFQQELESNVGKEIFPGVKINKKDTEQIYDYLRPKHTIEVNGEQKSVTYEQKLKYEDPVTYYLRWAALAKDGAFDKNADHKKVKQRQETQSTKKMAEKIENQQKKMKPKGGYKKTSTKGESNDPSQKLPDFGSLGIR